MNKEFRRSEMRREGRLDQVTRRRVRQSGQQVIFPYALHHLGHLGVKGHIKSEPEVTSCVCVCVYSHPQHTPLWAGSDHQHR